MTLGATNREVEMNSMLLHMVGFTDREINQFAVATDPAGNLQPPINLGDDTWRKMIDTRQKWIADIQESHVDATGKKYTRTQIDNIINSFYDKDPQMSPFDWLKKEYQKAKTNGGKIDHIEAARQRALTHTKTMRRYAKR
jgi:hypothetical protein